MKHESDGPRSMIRHTGVRRLTRPAGSDTGAGLLFWVVVLFLGSVALASVVLGLSGLHQPEAGGNNLQEETFVSKLNTENTGGVIPDPEPLPSQSEPDDLAPRGSTTPTAPAPLPLLEAQGAVPRIPDAKPLAVEPPLDLLPVPVMPFAAELDREPAPSEAESTPVVIEYLEPSVYLPRRTTPFGETPMLRTWNTLALATLLAAASPPIVVAGEKDASDPKAVLKAVEELRTKVDALTKKLDAQPKADDKKILAEIKKLEERVVGEIDKGNEELKARITAIETEQLRQKLGVGGGKGGLEEIRTRLSAIEKALATLQATKDSNIRKAFSPPTNGSVARVMLVNLYAEDLLFIVNDRSYRVEPNRQMQLDGVPAGALTYQVISPTWGSRAHRTTAVQPNETLTLTAR